MQKLIYFRKGQGNYRAVADQINGTINTHLSKTAWTKTSLARHLPSRFLLTFGLFNGSRQHVLMSHGVADKNYLNRLGPDSDLLVNKLEHLFVPGPWLRDKLLADKDFHLSPDQVSCVGWPRLDVLVKQQELRPPIVSGRPKLLWAPTHDWRKWGDQQISTSSYPDFAADFEALGDDYVTDVSLHPRNRSSKHPTSQQLIDADIVISDFGTMVYEAWALNKPVIFPAWLIKEKIQEFIPGSAEAHIFENQIGYHPQSAKELRHILECGPTVTPDVTAFLEEYLPSRYKGISGKTAADKLLMLARNL